MHPAPTETDLDGDGSIRPGDLTAMVEQVATGHADLCCGSRQPVARSAWPAHARWGNRVLADRRFCYPLETLLRARAAGWVISEHPIPYHPRDGGQSKVTGSVRGTVRALHDFFGVLVANRDLVSRRPR